VRSHQVTCSKGHTQTIQTDAKKLPFVRCKFCGVQCLVEGKKNNAKA
jgi:hypothetical protein